MTIDGTHKPLNNIVCYNMVLDITQFKDRPQKCTDYIEQEKMPNGIMDGFFCTVLEWHAFANPHPFSSYYIKYDLLTP